MTHVPALPRDPCLALYALSLAFSAVLLLVLFRLILWPSVRRSRGDPSDASPVPDWRLREGPRSPPANPWRLGVTTLTGEAQPDR